jgi:2-dehydro-3-deoxyphosphogluconate aldolase/(4S)-4-hydroxy-2-oxoglutarate aldolase
MSAYWIRAGAGRRFGAGSSLTAGAKTGDYDRVVRTAKLFVQNIKEARGLS